MSSLVQRASIFAYNAHHGQVRKYSGLPYILHPAQVAESVALVSDNQYLIAAAWLHDTVEDTDATQLDIDLEFGPSVGQLVYEVTNVSRPEDGNRAARKHKDLLHLADASAEGQTLKLADLINNTRSIVAEDPNFAVVYLAEKRALLKVLTRGNHALWLEATRLAG